MIRLKPISDEPSSLAHYSRELLQILSDTTVTEVCLQRSGELLIERASGWTRELAVWASVNWARQFAQLLATASDQRVSAPQPLLSAALPTGERVQIVLPPATWPDQVVMAVRRASCSQWSLDDLARTGVFGTAGVERDAVAERCQLADYYTSANWREFLSLAVKRRLNIIVSGATGSGKTTLTKALIREIPLDERLISIEDAAELVFDRHTNVARLFYSKNGQGVAQVTPKQLLEASLRLRPDRVLLAELRGEEAYYFLRNVSSGHPGSITSVHAGSPELAFAQLALLIKESQPGAELGMADIDRLLKQTVDVIVQCERVAGIRRVARVWWRDTNC